MSVSTSRWLGVLLLVAVAGCSDARRDEAERRADEAKREAAEAAATAATEAQEAAARAGAAAREAVDATREALDAARDSEAAQKAAEAGAAATAAAAGLTRTAATAVAGGALTAAVKTALMADRAIDASNIDVDTDEARRVVSLKGHVPTAAQRTAAVALARQKAPGYEISDQLVVGRP
jgi:osmotically-inducible protein OsmY